MNAKYSVSIANTAAALLVAQPELRALAKKAFTGYLRSMQLGVARESIMDITKVLHNNIYHGFTFPIIISLSSNSIKSKLCIFSTSFVSQISGHILRP